MMTKKKQKKMLFLFGTLTLAKGIGQNIISYALSSTPFSLFYDL